MRNRSYSCIGGVAEAAQAADQFSREGVGVSLTVTPCWCYGSETMDMDPLTPKAIWGFNGTERPGAVYLAAVSAAHAQKGIPAYKIYGEDVQGFNSDDSIPCRCAGKNLPFHPGRARGFDHAGKSLSFHGRYIYGYCWLHRGPCFFLNPTSVCGLNFPICLSSPGDLNADLFDHEEYARAQEYVKELTFMEGADYQWPGQPKNPGSIGSRVGDLHQNVPDCPGPYGGESLALAEKGWGEEAQGHHAIAAGFPRVRGNGPTICPMGTSWKPCSTRAGTGMAGESPYILATENDALNGVCMLFGQLLTHTAQVFADLRTFWSSKAVERVSGKKLTGLAENGILHLINSGPAALDGTGEQSDSHGKPTMKPYWEISDDEVAACNQSTTWHPSITEYFPGGGWSTRYQTKGGMPVTMTRLNVVKGLGPALQLVEGYTVELDEDVHEALDHRTNPTWPTTWFAPRLTGTGAFRSVYSVMDAWGSNHCVMTPGHVGADFISLAANLRIPVYMHNLEESQVFRPSSWTAFGTSDSEGADFRACEKLGPLYTAYK